MSLDDGLVDRLRVRAPIREAMDITERLRDLAQERELAAQRIEQLEKACLIVRENMNTHHNGGQGWMFEFEQMARIDAG